VQQCRKELAERDIDILSKEIAAACEADYDSSMARGLRISLKEADSAIENLWAALEVGQGVDIITERAKKREDEKKKLQTQLAIEMSRQIIVTEEQVRAFFHSLQKNSLNDEKARKGLINIFLSTVYLFEDRATMVFNGSDKLIVVDDILLDKIKADNEAFVNSITFTQKPPRLSIDELLKSMRGLSFDNN